MDSSPEYCFLWIHSACMPRSDWAAWVQAVGSIAAIIATWMIARGEAKSRIQERSEDTRIATLKFVTSRAKKIRVLCEAALAAERRFRAGKEGNNCYFYSEPSHTHTLYELGDQLQVLIPGDDVETLLTEAVHSLVLAAYELNRKFSAALLENEDGYTDPGERDWFIRSDKVKEIETAFRLMATEAQELLNTVDRLIEQHLSRSKFRRVATWLSGVGMLHLGVAPTDHEVLTKWRGEETQDKSP